MSFTDYVKDKWHGWLEDRTLEFQRSIEPTILNTLAWSLLGSGIAFCLHGALLDSFEVLCVGVSFIAVLGSISIALDIQEDFEQWQKERQ